MERQIQPKQGSCLNDKYDNAKTSLKYNNVEAQMSCESKVQLLGKQSLHCFAVALLELILFSAASSNSANQKLSQLTFTSQADHRLAFIRKPAQHLAGTGSNDPSNLELWDAKRTV